jgi:hypothetical protein
MENQTSQADEGRNGREKFPSIFDTVCSLLHNTACRMQAGYWLLPSVSRQEPKSLGGHQALSDTSAALGKIFGIDAIEPCPICHSSPPWKNAFIHMRFEVSTIDSITDIPDDWDTSITDTTFRQRNYPNTSTDARVSGTPRLPVRLFGDGGRVNYVIEF